MRGKLTRTWHVYFTLMIAIVYIVTIYLGCLANINPSLSFAILWLFTGTTICVLVNVSEPTSVNVKIILFWLPAIWSGKVRDWVMKR